MGNRLIISILLIFSIYANAVLLDGVKVTNTGANPVPVTVSGTTTVVISGDVSTATNQTNGAQRTQIVNGSNVPVNTGTLGSTLVSGDQALVVSSVIHGRSSAGGGTFVDVKVNPSGALAADVTGSSVSVSGTAAVTQSGSWNVGLLTGSNVIGSISNTSFGISGTLPAFASTPTFNIGTIGTIATESTLSTLNSKIPANPATDRTTAVAPYSIRLSDGTGFYKATTPSDTQPISAASLPLPSGAATSALQTTGNSSLNSIDTKTPALVSGRVPVDGSGVTQPISASSLPLPTGAATETTLSTINGKITAVNTGAVVISSSALPSGASTSALQTTGNSSLSSIDGKLPSTLGQKTMANSMAVVIASDQSAIPITGSITASNPSVSATGSAVPAQATYIAANNGGNLVGVTNTASGATKKPLDVAIYDASGNQITSFGGGTQYANGDASATPTGTVSLGHDGANVRALLTDTSGRAYVNLTDVTVSGNITAANANQTSGVPTANSVVESPDLAGYSTAVVQITGTFTASLNFYATVDNTNWVLINSSQIIGTTGFAGNTFSAGLNKINVSGYRRIRVNCSSYTSGTAVVTVRFSPSQFTQFATTAPSINIQQVNGSNVSSGVPVTMNGTQSATVTSVAASASSVQLLALNSNRRAAVFYNDSTSAVYIKYGTTASTSSFTYKILGGGTHEMVNHPYQGRIDAIWDSATGNMRITEW